MKTQLLIVLILVAVVVGAAPPGPSISPFESATTLTPDTPIDKLVLAKLDQLRIQPARLSSDAVFLRRAYLDVIGTLPTAQESRDFLQNKSFDKRRVLIDQLLQRSEFADYWAMKWSDILRVKAEFPINLWPNGAQAYHRWIRASIEQNKPYDRMARELLTSSGSNFRAPEVNFYRAMQSKDPTTIAQAVALTFMGCRAERWPKDRLTNMAAFFSQVGYKSTGEWKEEIIFFDITKPLSIASPTFPDGSVARLSPGSDPREAFADWLLSPPNPYFARNAVNRVWCWLVGRGIVHEPDDFRPDNPPCNPELLAYLERELVSSKYDLKHIYRLILNSRTYQLSSIPRSRHPDAETFFANYPLRRLEAEVLIDALNQITGSSERYSSAIPEPFTFIPDSHRSIALPDGSITSSFLEMFGRPSRDTGLESERNNRPTAAQRLHMLNSTHIQRKLEQARLLSALPRARNNNAAEPVTTIYLTILSRFPTDEEVKIARQYAQSGALRPRDAMLDLAWALINSDEFLFRH